MRAYQSADDFQTMIDMLDVDGDGELQRNELQAFGASLGLDAEAVEWLFNAADLNCNGSVTADELMTLFYQPNFP